jgi:aryl-alcohol dehydrogenase-like predicted oxidoreductase
MEGLNTSVPTVELKPGFHISRIIKGGWQLSSGHRAMVTSDPIADMTAFTMAGITTFDCADIYTGVEELIGKFLKEWRAQNDTKEPVRVLTKFVPDADVLPIINKAYVTKIIDRSLRRLGLERLDMVQFSWWDYSVHRYVETASWLKELQQEGKIELLSATNFNTATTAELVDAGIPLSTLQLQYSPLDRRPEKTLANLCIKQNIKLLCYGTVAGGFISKRWLGQQEPKGEFENRSLIKYKLMIDETGGWNVFQNFLETLNSIANKHQVSITNVVSQYMLSRPAVGAVIIGAANANHLKENLDTFSFNLDQVDLKQIESAAAQFRIPDGDVWDIERIKEGPHGRIMRYNLNAQATDN